MSGDHGEENNNVPLTDTQRNIVIFVHYLAFVVGAWNIWAFTHKITTLQNRIWSPFLLLLGLIWLQVGTALEIGNHYYEGNWELAGFPSDLVNGTFYFFNFGAQYLLALGLRKRNLPFFRIPTRKAEASALSCILNLIAMIFDFLCVAGVLVTGPMYAIRGRNSTISIASSLGAIAGIATVFRVWRNLGPNGVTLCGGVLFLVLALVGVFITTIYRENGVEFLHTFIGGSFVSSLIPLTIAILYSEKKRKNGGEHKDDNNHIKIEEHETKNNKNEVESKVQNQTHDSTIKELELGEIK